MCCMFNIGWNVLIVEVLLRQFDPKALEYDNDTVMTLEDNHQDNDQQSHG